MWGTIAIIRIDKIGSFFYQLQSRLETNLSEETSGHIFGKKIDISKKLSSYSDSA